MASLSQTSQRTVAPVDMERSDYVIPKMDCPSEERTIRLAFDGASAVRRLEFDLPARRLVVWHEAGRADRVTGRLEPLGYGARLVGTTDASSEEAALASQGAPQGAGVEARTLWLLLVVNGLMFIVELIAGLVFESSGLLTDSLDMLADAGVYGLSLYVVGRTPAHKLRATWVSGFLQAALAVGALVEVGRRAIWGSEPQPEGMMALALVALVVNAACLALVYRHRNGEVHMKASYIFSANDVLANLGVVVAGALVAVTGSHVPDLIVGLGIGGLVLSGAFRILRLAKPAS